MRLARKPGEAAGIVGQAVGREPLSYLVPEFPGHLPLHGNGESDLRLGNLRRCAHPADAVSSWSWAQVRTQDSGRALEGAAQPCGKGRPAQQTGCPRKNVIGKEGAY